jgi:PAS domain-containing protein
VGFGRLGWLGLAPVAARMVMDNLRDPVIVLDAAGRVADLNAAARRLFRVGDEAAGRAAAETLRLQPPDVWQKSAGAAEAQAEVEVAAAERAEQYQLTITPLRDERGRLLGRVALLHDVSHERALLKMRDDLAHSARSTPRSS